MQEVLEKSHFRDSVGLHLVSRAMGATRLARIAAPINAHRAGPFSPLVVDIFYLTPNQATWLVEATTVKVGNL